MQIVHQGQLKDGMAPGCHSYLDRSSETVSDRSYKVQLDLEPHTNHDPARRSTLLNIFLSVALSFLRQIVVYDK
jgi:hypothetical protein